MRRPAVLALAAALALGATPAVSPLDEEVSSENMRHVANLQWDPSRRAADGRKTDTQGGTDLEFTTIDGAELAVMGTYSNGLQIVDVTDPTAPELLATYECDILQGDVQTFTREVAGETRQLVTYTADSGYNQQDSECFTDLGIAPDVGTFIIDITEPTDPVAINFIPMAGGSHNMTVHPSGNYLYNSRSDSTGELDVFDITDLTVRNPEPVATVEHDGRDAHDITFNAAGDRAYVAALDHTLILDTSDPAQPVEVARIDDPAVTLHHQADPVRIGERTYVIINDEIVGAAGNEFCPGGGLHVWDITEETEPEKVGAFFIPEVTVGEGARTGAANAVVTCTSHVFRIYEEQALMTIAWFGAGVRVIDLSGLAATPPVSGGVAGRTLTPGMREIGYHRFPADSDAWAAKVLEFEPDGSAYIFANDQTRGLDVLRFDAGAPEAEGGEWLSADAALQRTLRLRASGFEAVDRPYCDLRGSVG